MKILFLCFIVMTLQNAAGQSVPSFPQPNTTLTDAKHKEPKSGVQLGPDNTLTIRSGVGTPTTINRLAFSGDSRLLAAGQDFGRVIVWDVQSWKLLSAVNTGQGIVEAVALSEDGQLLATGGKNDPFILKLWRLPEAKLVREYGPFNAYVRTAIFDPKGKWILVSDNAATIHVLNLASGKQLRELKETHGPLLSSSGDMLMTVGNAEFTLWDTSNWSRQRTLPRLAYAIPMAVNPKTDSFIVSSSGAFRLARLSTGELLPSTPSPEQPKFNAAAGGFAAFGSNNTLQFGHIDDRLWVWDTSTGKLVSPGLCIAKAAPSARTDDSWLGPKTTQSSYTQTLEMASGFGTQLSCRKAALARGLRVSAGSDEVKTSV